MQCHVSLTSLTLSIAAFFLHFFLLFNKYCAKRTFLNSARFVYFQTSVNISTLGSFKPAKNWCDIFIDFHFMPKILSGVYVYGKLACNQIQKVFCCISKSNKKYWQLIFLFNDFSSVDNQPMLHYIRDKTAVPYFSNLVWFIGSHVIELDNCVQTDEE